MKLAIVGDQLRGSEVILILESFGAENKHDMKGNLVDCLYTFDEVDDKKIIVTARKSSKHNYCYFTVDKFYKLYPFKVGDRVSYFRNQHICWFCK